MNDHSYPATEASIRRLVWAFAIIDNLSQMPADYEISGRAARRIGSIYFATPSPANDMRFTVCRSR